MKKIITPFILWYIRTAAQLQLDKIHPTIIGIGGSSGKTSLVELVGLMLSDHFKVRRTKGENSEIGLPLHILGTAVKTNTIQDWLRILVVIPLKLLTNWQKNDMYVVEMGIDSPVEPKNMSYLLKVIQPKVAVVTNITPEHSVYFDPYVQEKDEELKRKKILDMTAEQENMLLRSLPQDGVAVVNIDDPLIRKNSYKIHARQIIISTKDKTATLYAKEITIHPDAFMMEIVYKNKSYPLLIMQALPIHFAYEFLCAVGLALGVGLSIKEAITSLQQHFSLPPGRMTIFKGIRNTTIIDSTYNNATLPPILDMLDFLRTIGFGRRKVAIIGDMRELGSQSKENHEAVAQKILGTVNKAILIGPLMRNYAAPILKNAKFDFESFDTFTKAKKAIFDSIKEKDVIMVKGSQNTLFLERVVEMLLENPEDVDKLCRRGEFWDKKREATQ